jgi:hypothetical protein
MEMKLIYLLIKLMIIKKSSNFVERIISSMALLIKPRETKSSQINKRKITKNSLLLGQR